MSGKRTFAVTAIGVADNEHRILKNIFKLSAHRPRTYDLLDGLPDGRTEILIVDGDDDDAIAHWRAFRSESVANGSVPAVLVTHDKASEAHNYILYRPFVASRVLGVLDQVAIKELKYIPERIIGSTENISAPDLDVIKDSIPHNRTYNFTALVVDDSRPVRKQIELELDLLGVRADFAESGEQAITLLERKNYDIIFLDIVLPGIDGYKVCRTVKKDKLKRETPVVMLTSKSSPFDRIKGTIAGCDTYLTKPVAHESFKRVIKKYLS